MRLFKLDERWKEALATTWPAAAFALVVVALMAVRLFGPLRFLYLFGALAVGFHLQRVSAAAYVSFVLWLWFLSPFVRRVADLNAGWQDPSFILLTPYLVTSLSALTILRRAHRYRREPYVRSTGLAMFVFAAAGAVIGVPMGVMAAPATAILEILNWFVPLALGWYVATASDQLHAIERQVTLTFGRAALLVGAYGIYQFTNPPPWDSFWMQVVEMGTIGEPEPYAVRVFSTMHSPGVVGFYLAIPLALWLARPRAIGLPAAAVAGVTLLLSQSRSAWLTLMVAAALVVAALKPAQRIRAAILIVLASLGASAFLLTPEMSEPLSARIDTMGRLDEDTSALARVEGHLRALDFVASSPLGAGIGQVAPRVEELFSSRDSTVVAALVQYGLVGATLYGIGVCLLLGQLWRYYRKAASAQGVALACAGIGLLCSLWLGVPTAGPIGMCLWMIGGLAISDRHAARLRLVSAPSSAKDTARPEEAPGNRKSA